MPVDPLDESENVGGEGDSLEPQDMDEPPNTITHIETSNQWTEWRDNLAKQMFDEWRASGN